MTPSARLSAAITVLDAILAGARAEAALTQWGRASRFAGSGDRYALRDLVFEALRCKRSFAALGGSATGRGLILGGLRAGGLEPAQIDGLFSGIGHAPAVIGPADHMRLPSDLEASDLPDWLIGAAHQSLGESFPAVTAALRRRAPVFLRANPAKATRSAVLQELAQAGIGARPIKNSSYGLEVIENERKIASLDLVPEGRAEVQDAASQAVIDAIGLAELAKSRPNLRILDYCAGAGGKILNIAAQLHDFKHVQLFAHDSEPARMADIHPRAARAGAQVNILLNPEGHAPYDLVLTDVPCSGSGSWRRDPQGKWALTAGRLADLTQIQSTILAKAARLIAKDGLLAYVTCSFLQAENEAQIDAFLQANSGFHCRLMRRFGLAQGAGLDASLGGAEGGLGDGFFLALLARK